MHLRFLCNLKFIICFTVVSIAVLVLTLVLTFFVIPDFITAELNKNLRLENNTEQFDRFVELPFPLDFGVYVFNVENADKVEREGAKPIVKEIGPYIYKEYRIKTIEDVDEEEDTITFRQHLKFEFDQEASGNLSDTDTVVVLNTAFMGVLQTAEALNSTKLIANCIKEAFEGYDTMFISVTVKQLLFDGIIFCKKKSTLCAIINIVPCALAAEKKNIEKLEDGSLKFSFLNYKNITDDGLYVMKRGIKDISNLGEIVGLDNGTFTNYWKGNESSCNEVKGSDSTIYPPRIDKLYAIDIYSTDICRYMSVYFDKEAEYQDITGYFFQTDNTTLRTFETNPEDDCFCSEMTRDKNGDIRCFLDGVLDLQPCIGVPVLMSHPHFLWADEVYRNDVDGLKPNEYRHRIGLLIEPNTGTPLRGFKRVQMNMFVRPINDVLYTSFLPRALLPLIWIEEAFSLPDEYVDKLNTMYFDAVKYAELTEWVLIGISSVLTVIFSSILINKAFCNK